MCAHFTKAETESSKAILAAVKEAREHELGVKASLKDRCSFPHKQRSQCSRMRIPHSPRTLVK